MKSGIQSFMKTIGDYGCLVLCMIQIAEEYTGKQFDPVAVISTALDNKWLEDDMFVQEPAKIMAHLCGGTWTYSHSDTLPAGKTSEAEFYIERWEWKKPDGASNHFRLADWDSLQNSQTVKNGQIASYRILKKVS